MIYNFRFEIVAVMISAVILVSHTSNRLIRTRSIRLFTGITVLVLLSSLTDIFAIELLRNPWNYPIGIHYFVNCLYQVFFHSMGIVYFMLMYALSDNNKLPKRSHLILLSIPYIFSAFLDITNYFTHFVFYFDEQRNYVQGPHISFMYMQAWFYIILGCRKIIVHSNRFSKKNMTNIIFYTFVSIICVTIQWAKPDAMIMGFVISVAILLVYLNMENPMDYYDREMNSFNRMAFTNVCNNLLNEKKHFKIIGIKLEEMKYLNDSIGMENRILLMKSISSFLFDTFGKHNVYRLSRSKLAVIIGTDDVKNQKQLTELQNRFLSPFEFGNMKLSLTAFLDSVHCPEDADTVEDVIDLLENSFDDQMSLDKLTIVRANKEILLKKKRESQILVILEKAIENNGFEVVYQPIYSLKEGRYKSAEALVRLKETELGMISPNEFIPVAEKNGLIIKIGVFVFKEVCRFLSRTKIWEQGIECIHINLSVIQCMQEKLYDQLFEIMDFYSLPYSFISLDVTESSANASKETLKKNMDILLQKHVNFSLDDYGTGFSNTTNLVEYTFKTVKLDKSLIWDAMQDEKAKVILNRLIKMIKELGMKVIAEGVETKDQVEMVTNLDCDYIQGFYYSHPLSQKDFILFMD